MDTNAPRSGWDLYLFGIPLIALLVFGFFRLDEVFTKRKRDTGKPRPSPTAARTVQSMHSDPDGRLWDEPNSPRE